MTERAKDGTGAKSGEVGVDGVGGLRVGMLAPVTWTVPPVGYGPWEQVVFNLTERLVGMGHEVTLFAAHGSRSSATVVETVAHALGEWPVAEREAARAFDERSGLLLGPPDFRAMEQQHVAMCMEQAAAGRFDVVHSHLHVHGLVFSRLVDCPVVSTLHGAAWVQATHGVFERYREMPTVSLSDAERELLPGLNYVGTVHNGVEVEEFPFEDEKEDYLLFAGRLSPEKGAGEAVRIAQGAGRELRLAGLVEDQHREYFEREVGRFVDGDRVKYLGLLSQEDLRKEYAKAAAVLFPIKWCEPCSMVGIEAQACGTPIVGTRFGYLPELVREGETGYLVDTVAQAVEAVGRLGEIDANACRANVVERFSAERMARGYERVYRQCIAERGMLGDGVTMQSR